MNDGWTIARNNFTEDDGSLPGIEFANLAPLSVRALFEYFRSRWAMLPENVTLYDKSLLSNVPLQQVLDPVGSVVAGQSEPYYCSFAGISHNGVVIPNLGLFVFRDCIEIDYRMGAEWTSVNVNAFFRLLAHLKSIAPEAIIKSAENEGVPYPEHFLTALDRYTKPQSA